MWPITNEESLRQAAQVLLDTGLRRVFISLGSRGLFAADHRESLLLPCRPAAPVNATGAGDAFMAGLAWAYLEGTDLRGRPWLEPQREPLPLREAKPSIRPFLQRSFGPGWTGEHYNDLEETAMHGNQYLDIKPEVAEAIAQGKPVVALESTIISHGMPYPQNVETALQVEQIIRENGRYPPPSPSSAAG